MSSFDERDTIFSRMILEPGTPAYAEYYAAHPEREPADTVLRNAGDGVFADRVLEQSLISGTFRFLGKIRQYAADTIPDDRKNPYGKMDTPVEKILDYLCRTAGEYGAAATGHSPTLPWFTYSVRGRGPGYGTVPQPLPHTLMFVIPMQPAKIIKAPAVEESVEVVKGYAKTALLVMILTHFLRELGYEARGHMDGESELVMPAAAAAAGLGEIGRHGLLITKTHGPMVRLGGITTDLPVPGGYFQKSELRVTEFCLKCRKCAQLCPSGAIPKDNPPEGTPAPLWKTDPEKCFTVWKQLSTDCGVCIACCPYSPRAENPESADPLKHLMYQSTLSTLKEPV